MFKVLLVFVFSINCAFSIDIVPVKKGDPAPADGFYVSPADMKQFRQINEEKKLLEEKALNLEKLALSHEQRADIIQRTSDYYKEEYTKETYMGNLKGLGGVVLGVGLTLATTYIVMKAEPKWSR